MSCPPAPGSPESSIHPLWLGLHTCSHSTALGEPQDTERGRSLSSLPRPREVVPRPGTGRVVQGPREGHGPRERTSEAARCPQQARAPGPQQTGGHISTSGGPSGNSATPLSPRTLSVSVFLSGPPPGLSIHLHPAGHPLVIVQPQYCVQGMPSAPSVGALLRQPFPALHAWKLLPHAAQHMEHQLGLPRSPFPVPGPTELSRGSVLRAER